MNATTLKRLKLYNYSIQHCDKVCQWQIAAGRWFSPVSSINKTDRHDITEILLKVALNTINLNCISKYHLQIILKVDMFSWSYLSIEHLIRKTIMLCCVINDMIITGSQYFLLFSIECEFVVGYPVQSSRVTVFRQNKTNKQFYFVNQWHPRWLR